MSPRERPAKAPLSRAGIVEVAMRIMREEGLERATMRRIAAELDTGPASLYVYVDNTAELHGALLDELLTTLELPAHAHQGDWQAAIIRVLTDYTRILFACPSLARSVLALRPSGPHYLALIDALLGALLAGDVPPRQAAWGVDILLHHATATAAEQGTRDEAVESRRAENQVVTALRAADPREFPGIARAADELFSGEGEDRLRWAFAVLLTGIAAVPAGPDGPARDTAELRACEKED